MSRLELKVPPVLVAAGAIAVMWAARELFPQLTVFADAGRLAVVPLALAGVVIAGAGVLQFLLAGTTVNPHRVSRASGLVTNGVYRITRNPMYLGMALCLAAFIGYLGNAAALIGLPAFIAFMNRFQIEPEERAMSELFGDEFAAFVQRTRRWL